MKTFLVKKMDRISWCMDYAMVVVAEDELHAERCARCNSDDFKKAPLNITEIDVSETAEERVILTANTGA